MSRNYEQFSLDLPDSHVTATIWISLLLFRKHATKSFPPDECFINVPSMLRSQSEKNRCYLYTMPVDDSHAANGSAVKIDVGPMATFVQIMNVKTNSWN